MHNNSNINAVVAPSSVIMEIAREYEHKFPDAISRRRELQQQQSLQRQPSRNRLYSFSPASSTTPEPKSNNSLLQQRKPSHSAAVAVVDVEAQRLRAQRRLSMAKVGLTAQDLHLKKRRSSPAPIIHLPGDPTAAVPHQHHQQRGRSPSSNERGGGGEGLNMVALQKLHSAIDRGDDNDSHDDDGEYDESGKLFYVPDASPVGDDDVLNSIISDIQMKRKEMKYDASVAASVLALEKQARVEITDESEHDLRKIESLFRARSQALLARQRMRVVNAELPPHIKQRVALRNASQRRDEKERRKEYVEQLKHSKAKEVQVELARRNRRREAALDDMERQIIENSERAQMAREEHAVKASRIKGALGHLNNVRARAVAIDRLLHEIAIQDKDEEFTAGKRAVWESMQQSRSGGDDGYDDGVFTPAKFLRSMYGVNDLEAAEAEIVKQSVLATSSSSVSPSRSAVRFGGSPLFSTPQQQKQQHQGREKPPVSPSSSLVAVGSAAAYASQRRDSAATTSNNSTNNNTEKNSSSNATSGRGQEEQQQQQQPQAATATSPTTVQTKPIRFGSAGTARSTVSNPNAPDAETVDW